MESIPVLGTAIVNAPHWVWRLFYSIDYPVDNFVVFNNNGRGQIDRELDLLKTAPHRFVKNVHVCHLPANLGCSGAWNLIIKSYMKAPYWVISNHDVMYEPGFLQEMAQEAAKPEIGVVHGKNGGWDIFALKDWMVQRYGLFDENLYPGYCEDMDYGMRFIHDDVPRTVSLEAGYYHGNKKDDYSDGSQTWRSEPAIARGVHVAHEMNKAYVTMKWNEAWQGHVEGETHKTPFNLEQMPVSFTTYDLDFVRRKHLGF